MLPVLELFPDRWKHLFDKEMRLVKEIERQDRSHLIGKALAVRLRSAPDAKGLRSLRGVDVTRYHALLI